MNIRFLGTDGRYLDQWQYCSSSDQPLPESGDHVLLCDGVGEYVVCYRLFDDDVSDVVTYVVEELEK